MTTTPPVTGSNQIVLYQADDGTVQMDVRLQDDTIWLSQKQMSALFDKDIRTINDHLQNIFEEGELKPDSTIRNFRIVQKEGKREVEREIEYYNLDGVISVGYRVNSKRGTQFRIWATNVLRKHLIEGYTFHQKRLRERGTTELEEALALISKAKSLPELSSDQAKGLLDIVTGYTRTWLLLRKYDDGAVEMPVKLQQPTYRLTYDDALKSIRLLKENLVAKGEASDLFGMERSEMLQAIIGNLYQTFDRKELYSTLEEKAAHLLYFVIKDHPFSDGNKRIGVLLFLMFLQNNTVSLERFSDATLVALALLIAESDPKEKDTVLRLILHFSSS